MKTSLALAVFLGACGGGGGGSSPVDIGDLGTQFSDALCTKAFKCCTQMQLSALFQSTTTLTTTAQCESYVEGLLNGFTLPRYNASIAAGRVTYDGNAAAACLDVISQATCSEFELDATDTVAPPGCTGYLMPEVAAGGGCTQNYECTTGYCMGAVTTPTPTDGHCATIPTMGQPCDSTCASGLYCDFGTLTCQPTQADGADCTTGSECTSGGCVASMCGAACAA